MLYSIAIRLKIGTKKIIFSNKELEEIDMSMEHIKKDSTGVDVLERPERISHLNEGVNPIIACIGTYKDFRDKLSIDVHSFDIDLPSSDVDIVDYNADETTLSDRNMKNAGAYTYVISEVNDRDKMSNRFYNCTSLVAVGTDKETGKNISIMSHQDPEFGLGNEKVDLFIADISNSIEELKSRCVGGTIDVIMAGGSFTRIDREEQYRRSIRILTEQVKKNLGFEPYVIVGPKIVAGADRIVFDNENRRLYVIRPNSTQGDRANFGYSPGNLDGSEEGWRTEREEKKKSKDSNKD